MRALLLLCAVWIASGSPFTEKVPAGGMAPGNTSFTAPERTEAAAFRTGIVPVPNGTTLRGKTDGLSPVRSTSYQARKDGVPPKKAFRSRRAASAKLLQDIGRQFEISRSFATSA